MAVGTTLSRLTGVGRVVALTAALSGGGFADAYNLANTTPNIITDIVIGGVLAATFVPVFVSELTTKAAKEAWEAISAVVTVTVTIVVVATVAFFVLTPSIIDLYTVTNHHADVHQQQVVATFLLRWFVPQLACYGLIALFTALLNTQGKFAAPMFVPIANNLVVIGMLVWFHALVPEPQRWPPSTPTTRRSSCSGIGTTLGVVVQAALLVPSLLRSDLRIRFRWQPGHEAMRRISRLAGWTFGIVLSNQVALVVVLALADGARVPGAVSAYTYAYTFFQLPYGVVAVSVMSAVTPSLSARWAEGDIAAFRHRMAFGLRSILAIIIPSAVGMIILAHPLIDLVLDHGAETSAQAVDHRGDAGHVRPGAPRVLHLPLHGPGTPGHAGHPHRVPHLPGGERHQHRAGGRAGRSARRAGPGSVGLRGLHGRRLHRPVGGGQEGRRARWPGAGDTGHQGARRHRGHGRGHVLAVNVSGATSGLALLGRVVLAVVVGAVAFVGTASVLGSREARRTAAARHERTGRGPVDGPMEDPADDVGAEARRSP